MGDVIDIRRGKKRRWVTLQRCPKTSYELGLEDERGNIIPERMAAFMRSAEFYLLCKGTRGLVIEGGKRPSDEKRKGGLRVAPRKERKHDKRYNRPDRY